MKLRYYLRGLAVGILISTIVLTVANRDNRPLTDEQIRRRALELGMVDGSSARLSSLQSEESKSGSESSLSDDSPEGSEPESGEENPAGEDDDSAEESGVESAPAVDGEEDSTSDAQPIVFQIRNGASSYTVSRDLAALGLVEDAATYDQFLCDNGYSRRIHVGTYEIMPGTGEEDIAKLIAR